MYVQITPPWTRRTRRFAITGIALGLSLAASFGQTAQKPTEGKPPEKNEDESVLVLSPFVVTAEENRGYEAVNTLAGSRLRTPLSDVGAAISVVTKQFLDDTHSTDLRDVLVYTASTEVTGFGGNLAGGIFDFAAISNSTSTRVRGLAAAELTRGYFRTHIPFDRYNSGSLEINRGANAILFGVGSPAGIINYTPEIAQTTRTFGSVGVSTDQYGSFRSEADFNQSLWNKQAGIRLSLLQDNERFKQKPAFNDDQRGYLALTISPNALKTANGLLSGTTLRVSGERGNISANNPRMLPPRDQVSQWFEPPPRFLQFGLTPKPIHDASGPFNQNNGLIVMDRLVRSPILVFPDAASALASDPISGTGGAGNVVGRQFASSSLAAGGTKTVAMLSTGEYQRALGFAGDPNASFIVSPSITDTSIFDFRNQMLDGAKNKRETTHFNAENITLEQLLFKGQAGFEVTYDRQETTGSTRSMLGLLGSDGTQFIGMDVNTVLIDGTVNPNFGKPFTSGELFAGYGRTELKTIRATAYGQLDFKKVMRESRLARWLGRHTLTLLYQDEDSFVESRSGRQAALLDPFPFGLNQNRFDASGKQIAAIHYLGPSLATQSTARGSHIPGITADRSNIAQIANSGQFLVREQKKGAPFQLVNLGNVVPADELLTETSLSAGKSFSTVESKAVNLQSYLLNDAVIFNVGWRQEEATARNVNAPVNGAQANRLVNDSRYVLPDAPDQTLKETLFSWNVVTKVPDRWIQWVPGKASFSLFYNESENFAPPQAPRRSPLTGDVISAPNGQTKDYGFILGFFDGRLNLKVNRYETAQADVTNGGLTFLAGRVIRFHKLAFDAVTLGFVPDSDGDHFPDGYVPPPSEHLKVFDVQTFGDTLTSTNPGVAETSNFVSKGLEFELGVNVLENWTVTFNASRQNSVRSGSGETLRRLYFETPLANGSTLAQTWPTLRIPLFLGASQDPLATTGFLSTDFLGDLGSFNGQVGNDGGPAQELRRWRFNAATNYKFRRGLLKGFSVGGAVRWQDNVAIGFPLTTIDGVLTPDVTQPFMGPTAFNGDGWIGYERTIFNDKVKWRLQLNIRNLIGEQALIPVQVQPTGEAAVFRIPQPRIWTFSSNFSF